MILGGDLHVGDRSDDALAPLRSVLHGSPFLVNLEGPIAPFGLDGAPPQTPIAAAAVASTNASAVLLHNAPSAVRALRGVTVAGIANNHARDAGEDGPAATAAFLREQAGIEPAGFGHVAVIARGRARIAVTAHDLGTGVPASLREDLRAARSRGTALVATFHVTGPPLYLPPAVLREAAAVALEEGASVVASHGTHTIGPLERRDGAVIAWGLGNLAFGCDCTDEAEAILLEVTLDGAKVVSARPIPIDAGLGATAHAQPASDPQAILDLLEAIR